MQPGTRFSMVLAKFSPTTELTCPQREINDLEPPACFYYALKSVNLTVPPRDKLRVFSGRIRPCPDSIGLWVANCYFSCKNEQLTDLVPDSGLSYPV
jgi:hypothetical protein